MLGFGVMIHQLAGNSETVNAYHESMGKKIKSVTLDDDVLNITLDDGSTLIVQDNGQSCCEHRYMTTDDDLSYFSGATLEGMELKDAPDEECEYDVHEVQFLEVKTDKGVFTMASHNEHNGYYGGFAIELSIRKPE